MSQEELKDPQLMVDDIDSINNGETKARACSSRLRVGF